MRDDWSDTHKWMPWNNLLLHVTVCNKRSMKNMIGSRPGESCHLTIHAMRNWIDWRILLLLSYCTRYSVAAMEQGAGKWVGYRRHLLHFALRSLLPVLDTKPIMGFSIMYSSFSFRPRRTFIPRFHSGNTTSLWPKVRSWSLNLNYIL